MSREFNLRVSEELGRWVKDRGPAGHVLAALASVAQRGQLDVGTDPGPGPARLTVRVPNDLLPWLRAVTHSRNALVGLRKLLLAGYEADVLSLPQRRLLALPASRIIEAEVLPQRTLPSVGVRPEPRTYPIQFARPLVSEPGSSPCQLPKSRPASLRERLAGLSTTWLIALAVIIVLTPLAILLAYSFLKQSSAGPSSSVAPRPIPWVPRPPSALAAVVWHG